MREVLNIELLWYQYEQAATQLERKLTDVHALFNIHANLFYKQGQSSVLLFGRLALHPIPP